MKKSSRSKRNSTYRSSKDTILKRWEIGRKETSVEVQTVNMNLTELTAPDKLPAVMKRRQPWCHGGDGLYKRGRSWIVDFRYQGKRYKITIGPLPNRSAAREVAIKRRADIIKAQGHGIARPAPRLSLEKAKKLFVDWAKGDGRIKTARWYDINLMPVLKFFKDRRLDDISSFDLERYKKARVAAGAPVGVNRELTVLSTLYRKMMEWGKATENPVSKVKRVQEPEGRTRWLNVEELGRLLAACSERLRPVVIAAIHTGLRQQNLLLNLKVGNVDFKRRVITAERTKSGKSHTIPMNKIVIDTLRPLTVGRSPDAPVFLNRNGQPYKSVRTAFATACRNAGITDFHFHDLRHTNASHLIMSGVDLKTVSELLGHASIRSTERYCHLAQEHKRHAVEQLDKTVALGVPPDFTPSTEEPSVVVAITSRKHSVRP